MLSVHHNQLTGEVCLLIKTDLAQAWISYYPPAYLPRDGPDWRLRVRLAPHEPVLGRKTQTGLMIESHLRAWLLQRFRRRLRDMRFAQLRKIAELQSHLTRERSVK